MKPEIIDIAYGILSVVALGYGVRVYQKEPGHSFVSKLLRALLPVGVVTFLGMCFRSLLQSPYWPLNPGRLALTFALKKGVLYSSPDQGPLLVNQFGPVNALSYWPTVWTSTSTRAVLLGVVLAILYFFLPLLWLHLDKQDKTVSQDPVVVSVAAFLCLGFYVFLSAPLSYVAFGIHADAPELGLVALACGLLYFRKQKEGHWELALSALCAVLALWTKPTALSAVVACLLFLGCTEGGQSLKRYLGFFLFWGTLFSGLFLVSFHPSDLFYCLVTVPRHYPFIHARTGMLGVLWGEGVLLLGECRLPLLLLLFLLLNEGPDHVAFSLSQLRQRIRDNRWSLFLMAAFLSIPVSLLHKSVLAADVNAFCDTVFFFAIAASLAVIQRGNQRGVRAGLCAALIVFIGSLLPSLVRLSSDYTKLRDNPLRQACQFALKHPGEIYFPMDPLTTLMSEGRLYHFEVGLYDVDAFGLGISQSHLREFLPEKMRWIAYPNSFFISGMKYFPEFNKKVEVPDLPGWTVFSRS